MTELTILMPCLNEAETLASCIVKARAYLDRSGIKGEIVIADNGSNDGSQDIARELGARVVSVPRRGYGAALGAGIAAASGRYIIMGDSDDSYDFAVLDGFVARLRDGADVVMGNRFRGGIAPGAMPPLHRYLGNPVLSLVGRVLYRAPVGDFHCGLRGVSRASIQRLGLQATGMEYASEMVIKAALAGMRIEEVPTTLAPAGRSRAPHLRSWRDGWRHLKLLLTFAPFSLFLLPGVAILAIGLPMFMALITGPVRVGGVTFATGSLILSGTMVLGGVQMLWFHALARLFTVRFGLLPSSPRFEALRRWGSVEAACTLGVVLLVAAVITSLGAVVSWANTGFGDLGIAAIARTAALVSVLAGLGLQAVTNGFLWGLMAQNLQQDHDVAFAPAATSFDASGVS